MNLDSDRIDASSTVAYSPCRTLNTYGDSQSIGTIVKFDDYEELLWVGANEGHLSSYYGPSLSRYTAFAPFYEGELRDFCITDPGILALTSCGLSLHKRSGGSLYTPALINSSAFNCCLAPSTPYYPDGTVVVAGKQGMARKLNFERPDLIETIQIGDLETVLLKGCDRFLCFGTSYGDVGILDYRSNQTRHHRAFADSMVLCDFDLHDYSLFMCVHGMDHAGNLLPTYSICVYDMRVCKPTSPIITSIAPSLIRCLPNSYGQWCAVADGDGKFQLVNSYSSADACEKVHRLGDFAATPVSMEFSSSGSSLAIADTAGLVHVLSRGNVQAPMQWNIFSRSTDIPEVAYQRVSGALAIAVDPYLMAHSISPKPHPLTRSQKNSHSCPTEILKADTPSRTKPNLLDIIPDLHFMEYTSAPGSPPILAQSSREDLSMPLRSRSRKPQISDWKEFNTSELPALEPELPNSYCNGVLQVLFNITPLAALFQSHICYNEFCLSCELGFLFHMMTVAGSEEPCQASNLYRVLRSLDDAMQRGLIASDVEELHSGHNAQILMQNWVRFVFERTHQELSQHSTYPAVDESPISRLTSWSIVDTITHGCGHVIQEHHNVFALPLRYYGLQNHRGPDLHQVLRATLNETTEWLLRCETCSFESAACFSRRIACLPESFVLNFHLENAGSCVAMKQMLANWTIRQLIQEKTEKTPLALTDVKACRYGAQCSRSDCLFLHPKDIEKSSSKSEAPNFIPRSLWMNIGNDGRTEVVSTRPLARQKWTEYQVTAVTYVFRSKEKGGTPSFVSAVKSPDGAAASPWHFYEDLVITPTSQREALQFDLNFRIPCSVFYARIDLNQRWSTTVVNPITRDIFLRYCEQSVPRGQHEASSVIPIQEKEVFGPEDLVALDAEFVSLSDGEVELHPDGTKSTLKPSLMSLGRVTVIRGKGILAGIPFMDEYVVARDKIVDHLTEFSGIHPGDLSADFSSKRLQTLKSVYVRLRYLVDSGVQFVGHGLNNDFRVINIKVPKRQIIDTVQLFRLPDQRLISLRFLAWYFLGNHIQLHSHDSIEDAQSALHLHEKYESLAKGASGSEDCPLVDLLSQMYEIGRFLQWKIPLPEL